MCRFTNHQGKRKAISTKLIPRNWNQTLQSSKNDPEVNKTVRIWQEIAENSSSFESLVRKLTYKSKSILLTELVDTYISYRKQLSDGTKEKYRGFKEICIDIEIDQIDKRYVMELYNKFLTHMNENSAANRMKQLSFFLKFAVDFDYIPKNVVSGMKFKVPDKEIQFLSREELDIIENKDMIGRLNQVRDIFVFQCYTAMEYSRLSNFEVRRNIDGELWIYSYRKKTKKKADLPMFDKAFEIWSKYDKELPIKSNAKMNSYLKEIQDICGIEKKLTTHLGRHTFATTICIEQNVPKETVAKMMGITLSRLESTYGEVTSTKVSNDTKHLINRIAN